jgi:hypothetical protein
VTLEKYNDREIHDEIPTVTVLPNPKDKAGPTTRIDYIKTTIFKDNASINPRRLSMNIVGCFKPSITKNHINDILINKFIKENK